MDKMKRNLVAIYVPVIVVVVIAVLVGAVVIAASGPGTSAPSAPQMAAHVEPQAGEVADTAVAVVVAQPVQTEPTCNFTTLVGTSLKNFDATTYAPRPVRVLHPGSAATMDYSPSRINIKVDDNQKITDVTCG